MFGAMGSDGHSTVVLCALNLKRAFSLQQRAKTPKNLYYTNKNTTMKIVSLVVLSLIAVTASALELTPDNWDSETAGKTVLIKFLAPW